MRALRLLACLSGPLLGIGLTGCIVGPDFQNPEMREAPRRSASDGGSVPSRTVEGAIDIVWWKSFRDVQLSSLVEKLVAQNLDLQTAAERVVQSVAQRQVAVSQGLPHIEGQSSSTYNRQSPNGTLSLITPAPGAPLEYALFHDGLTSSWQLDLFGRVRRAVEAANANTLAAVENRHGVALAAATSPGAGRRSLMLGPAGSRPRATAPRSQRPRKPRAAREASRRAAGWGFSAKD